MTATGPHGRKTAWLGGVGQNQGVRWLLCQRWQAVWDDSALLQLQLKDKMHVKTKKERQREEGSAKLAVVHFRGRHGNHSGRAPKKNSLWALIQKSPTNLFIVQSIQSIYSILLSLLLPQYSSEKEFSVLLVCCFSFSCSGCSASHS